MFHVTCQLKVRTHSTSLKQGIALEAIKCAPAVYCVDQPKPLLKTLFKFPLFSLFCCTGVEKTLCTTLEYNAGFSFG